MSKILVADDNAQNLYLARFLLEKAGYEVDEVVNGEEAVRAVEKNTYDLILMDIQMPVLDGLEATRRIKKSPDAPCVIALTAKAMAGDRENILAAGCDGYIAKPIEAQSFLASIGDYLS